MATWRNALHRLDSEDGTTCVEYALLLALIGLVVIVGATGLGDALGAIFTHIVERLPLG